EYIRNFISTFSFHRYLYILDGLTLFLQYVREIKDTARSQSHQNQFHRTYAFSFATDAFRTVDMHFYVGKLARAFKMYRIVFSLAMGFHVVKIRKSIRKNMDGGLHDKFT